MDVAPPSSAGPGGRAGADGVTKSGVAGSGGGGGGGPTGTDDTDEEEEEAGEDNTTPHRRRVSVTAMTAMRFGKASPLEPTSESSTTNPLGGGLYMPGGHTRVRSGAWSEASRSQSGRKANSGPVSNKSLLDDLTRLYRESPGPRRNLVEELFAVRTGQTPNKLYGF